MSRGKFYVLVAAVVVGYELFVGVSILYGGALSGVRYCGATVVEAVAWLCERSALGQSATDGAVQGGPLGWSNLRD